MTPVRYRDNALVGHLEKQQVHQLLDVVTIAHAIVAEGKPELS